MENELVHLEDTQNRLSALKYSQLRKAAKRFSVNANQKKEVLIMELSKVWKHRECNKENIIPREIAESKVDMSCSSKGMLSDTLNQTFTVERASDSDVTENSIAANEGAVGKKSILQCSQEVHFVPVNDSSSSRKTEQDISTPFKGRSTVNGSLVARFAALHQKLAEKQPTLQEADANVKRKFAEHEKAVPDIFKRLATPKVLKNAKLETGAGIASEAIGHKFSNVIGDPSKMDFSFSKLYGTRKAFTTVQNYNDVQNTNSRIPLPCKQKALKIGVKDLTKGQNNKQVRRSPRLTKLTKHINSVTVPQLSARLQRLATPKGKNPEVSLTESEKETLRKCGRRYVPYRRMIPYVDTTKMTDSQFHEAKMLGHVPTFTALSASRTETRQQLRLKRNEAREQILKAKRGC